MVLFKEDGEMVSKDMSQDKALADILAAPQDRGSWATSEHGDTCPYCGALLEIYSYKDADGEMYDSKERCPDCGKWVANTGS